MSGRWRLAYASFAALCAFAAVPTQAGQKTIFDASVMVESGSLEDDGGLWFKPAYEPARFVLAKDNGDKAAEMWRLIYVASGAYRSITVRFDAAAGRLNETTGTVDFPICSVSLDDQRILGPDECRDEEYVDSKLSGDQAVGLGWAQLNGGSTQAAKALLDRAFENKPRSAAFDLVALQVRASTLDSIAHEAVPESEEADRANLAALADWRALAALKPDNADFFLFGGYNLEALGDYQGAQQVYRQAAARWPDEEFQTTVRLAAIERWQGNYEKALELINTLVAKHPDSLGMKFYYHRGWTLTKLRRYDEAIADFSEGLKTQPDYAWAYMRRACVHASIGQLAPALEDVRIATGILSKAPIALESRIIRHDVDRFKVLADLLSKAIDQKSSAPMPAVCEGFWSNDDRQRTPSPLLTQAGQSAPPTPRPADN